MFFTEIPKKKKTVKPFPTRVVGLEDDDGWEDDDDGGFFLGSRRP